jgi:type IV secretion system protein VirB10
MPDQEPQNVPQVTDKRLKVSGLLPKNAQARILAGIALLMIVIISLSGRNTPKERPSTQTPAPVPADPSQARIQEYRARIEEQAKKLAQEEAELTQTKEVLGLAPARPGAAMPPSPRGPSAAAHPDYPSYMRPEERERRSPEIETPKRDPLFASNIVLTYRPAPGPARATPGASAAESPASVRAEGEPSTTESKGVDLKPVGAKQYKLFEGTVIETVLTNRLDSSFSGPVNCMATTNVYSHDRQHVLIPQGTRVLGEVRKLETMGEQRLAVCFHRLIMPDGFAISLDKFQGLNQIGETGLRDQVNHHYAQIFGVSLAIGALAGLAQTNTRYSLDTSAADSYRQGMATSLTQSSLHILDRYLNVLPTYTIREGHRVKIYLSQDLMLPAYDAHHVPSDL